MTSEAPSQAQAIRQFREICEAVVQPIAWSGKGDAGRVMMERVRQMLDDGLDPNAVDEDGVSLIGRVALLTRGSNEAGTRLGTLLMERGANPMLLDCPLGRHICHQNASLLTTNTIFFLAQRERNGQGLRDEHGGTVLHYLAQVSPSLATDYLNDDLFAEPGNECFGEAMINQRREKDGRTALDALGYGGALPLARARTGGTVGDDGGPAGARRRSVAGAPGRPVRGRTPGGLGLGGIAHGRCRRVAQDRSGTGSATTERQYRSCDPRGEARWPAAMILPA